MTTSKTVKKADFFWGIYDENGNPTGYTFPTKSEATGFYYYKGINTVAKVKVSAYKPKK